jgi:dTDP-4-amino-4,6-dideoxygalactose transaminase
MSDLHASLGLTQFAKFETLQELRLKAFKRYMKNLSDLDFVKLPTIERKTQPAWHLFLLRLKLNRLRINRDAFISELNRRRIGTSVHYIPLFLQTYYRKQLRLSHRDFPKAYKAYREVITLPFFPDLKKAEIEYVCDAIADTGKKFRR